MRRLIAVAGAAMLMLVALAGCTIGPNEVVTGSGKVVTENRNLSGFNSIELSGIGMLVLTQDGTESVIIEGEDNILSRIRTEVAGNTLRIGIDENVILNPTKDLIYRVNVSEIKSLSLTGAGSIQAGDLRSESLAVNTTGAGNVNIEKLTAEDLKVTSSGVGNTMIGGSTSTQEITISGVGNYQAPSFGSKEATIKISGAGGASVQVSDHLTVEISGAGNVTYSGDPKVDQKITGAGSVSKR